MERTTFRPIRSLLLLLLALTALTVSALADNAPKPQLTVLVENPPQEIYYLDLVAEGPAGEDGSALSWTYSDQEIANLDPALLSALTAAVPEGYHACTVQGGSGAPLYGDLLGQELRPGVRSHYFFYTGVPTDYQILVVTRAARPGSPRPAPAGPCRAPSPWIGRPALSRCPPWPGATSCSSSAPCSPRSFWRGSSSCSSATASAGASSLSSG